MKINLLHTDKLTLALNAIQRKCTARIYDAISIRRIGEKFATVLSDMGIPKRAIYGCTISFGGGYGYGKKWGEPIGTIGTILIEKSGMYLIYLSREGCGERSRAVLTEDAKNELAKAVENRFTF